MKVGRIEIAPVLDGSILSKLHATKAFPPPGAGPWQDQHGMFRPDGLIESTLGAFLVRAGDRVVLVDAGGGQPFPSGYAAPVIDVDDPDDPIASTFRARGLPDELVQQLADDFGRTHVTQGELPASLDALGVRPEEITDLVFTHLHFDHIGWASAEGSAFFPNATIRCASADLDHCLAGPDEELFVSLIYGALPASERLAPVLDRIEAWESDQTLMPGVDVRLAPGHTPGSSVIVISDGGARAMLLGDIIHCPLELMDDDFNLLVDHDQELANRVREAYARELEGGDVPAAAAHFPGLRFGRLLPSEGTRRWTFATG
jgi:glyoxylase-like metal-dependent hydrolase (beta-lactamase superfamily II)